MLTGRFLGDETGAAMVELTIVVTLLFTLVLGFVDFGYAFYQWNAATKAVQVGARLAAISTPIPANLVNETNIAPTISDVGEAVEPPDHYFEYVCTADADANVSCECNATTTEECSTAINPEAFPLIYGGDDGLCTRPSSGRPGMCDFFPGLNPDEVRIEYVATGLGYWTRAGGPVPTIRVSVENHPFQFFFLSGLLSFAPITMPNMLSTITGEDLCTLGTTC